MESTPSSFALWSPAQTRPQLTVGDTCYVTARVLNVRSQPESNGFIHAQFGRNYQVVVLDLPNRNWIHVQYWNGDVGVTGYVSQGYLAKQANQ